MQKLKTRFRSRKKFAPAISGPAPASRQNETRHVYARLLHRTSQPLTALRGTLDVALIPGQSREDLEIAIRAALEITIALSGDFALLKEAIEADDPGDQAQDIQWTELVRQAIRNLSERPDSRQVRIAFRPLQHSIVRANPERLLSATEAFLRHAVAQCSPGGSVRASLARRGKDLILSVNCRVMPPSTPAARPTSTRPSLPEETSLWILNRMVEAQGGSFRTESSSPRTRRLSIRLKAVNSRG